MPNPEQIVPTRTSPEEVQVRRQQAPARSAPQIKVEHNILGPTVSALQPCVRKEWSRGLHCNAPSVTYGPWASQAWTAMLSQGRSPTGPACESRPSVGQPI